ncbi:mitochondrial ribosomal protein L23 [Vararia minispora EC-137]|uniref:Mitochondrial ribosomal protein L23 n=1 Tax=Vararia minispora EC-137 TaxID=1314806 RepID=A0ACB8QBA9_9AGAM|nr:mitochondrial ribosomal protein L23 [Vararia minispora EC-137]
MQATLRRSYATISNEAAAARSASTPLAVRIRRLRRKSAPKIKTLPGSDAHRSGMTPSDYARYMKDKYEGHLPEHATQDEWLERQYARRRRIRGLRQVGGWVEETGADGEVRRRKVTLTEPVGEKIYLPNVVIRLMPNPTRKGEPYNPYEATFRIPPSFTKTDLRSYLHAVYGVATTYIRTDNYIAPITRIKALPLPNKRVRGPAYKTYKRATIGLVDPFYYPDMVEDMSAEERSKYTKRLDQVFNVQERKDMVKRELLRYSRSNSKDWEWDGPLTVKRGVILRRIAEQRAARERKVENAKHDILFARAARAESSQVTTET